MSFQKVGHNFLQKFLQKFALWTARRASPKVLEPFGIRVPRTFVIHP